MPQDLMMRCEQKRLYKVDGQKVWRWVDMAVVELSPEDTKEVRCMHCHGQIKMPKQKAPSGPQDHVEHKLKKDSETCRGGNHFLGDHRLSSRPVE
ncbi:MAG: hypothetical protein H0W66_12185 [Chthoniobacterales bacterium]|nr:hypothetical protein [Chthoniobacterales bacterium]